MFRGVDVSAQPELLSTSTFVGVAEQSSPVLQDLLQKAASLARESPQANANSWGDLVLSQR